MDKQKVVFRADGNTQTGLGHVVRSLALAEMLSAEYECIFAIQAPSQLLEQQIKAICPALWILPLAVPGVTDSKLELDTYLSGNEIVILDGYKFGTDYQQHIKNKKCILVCIDDIHAYHFVADLVINHGLLDASAYSKEPKTKLLLGPCYSLLRRPFLRSIQDRTLQANPENDVFLCFGGSDSLNLTCKYLERLLQMTAVSSVQVVVGSAFEHNDRLEELIRSFKEKKNVFAHHNIKAEELVNVIAACKVAIVPGSTVALECASVGIKILCGYYVDNQHDIVHMLTESGMALSLGDLRYLDDEQFFKLFGQVIQTPQELFTVRQRTYFDGQAEIRFRKEFSQLQTRKLLWYRKTQMSDVDLLFEWTNEAAVRRNAIHTEPIAYENHCNWLEKKLASDTSFSYLFFIRNEAIGQVRFDREDFNFIISYSIAEPMRGKSLATPMLTLAIEALQHDVQQDINLKALVKVDNISSHGVFKNMFFHNKGVETLGESDFVVYQKKISPV